MRKTKLSIAVQDLFAESREPLSVVDIQQKLKERHMVPNKTTLYRMLERFCAEGVTHKLTLTHEVAHYEKVKDPHAHFVCTACDHIECLPTLNPARLVEQASMKTTSAQITSAQLALKGLCSDCA